MKNQAEISIKPADTEQDERVYTASHWQLVWWKFKDHKAAHLAMYVVLLFCFAAIFCEFLSPNNPYKRNVKRRYTPPQRVHLFHNGGLRLPFVYPVTCKKNPETFVPEYTDDTSKTLTIRLFVKCDEYKLWGFIPLERRLIGLSGGEPLYLLGGDMLGRDMYSRILYGGRISLSLGVVGVIISFVLGVVFGGISGFYGGWVDMIIQRVIEVLRSFPTIPLWLALSAAMPTEWSQVRVYFCMTLILALLGWTGLARVVRGKILALREEDYAVAAKVAGVREFSIIMRHLIPGFMGPLIVGMTIRVPGMILAETALSFLRLGLRPPTISWGVLLQNAQNVNAITLYPWLMFPVLFVIVAVLTFNFMGDGLRDAVDPYKN